MTDLLVKLYGFDLEQRLNQSLGEMAVQGIAIKRASIIDKDRILQFVRQGFGDESAWPNECEYALFNNPSSCYIAVQNGQLVGFGCYDATAKGFFGPTGVAESHRGKGIGAALMLKCLNSMKEAGYVYVIVGWIAPVMPFYEKVANAVEIPDSPPHKSVYQNLIDINSV